MTIYDRSGEPERSMHDPGAYRPPVDRQPYSPQPFRAEPGTGYRPGWIWIPVAVLFLLMVLVIATGFVYGDYSSRLRGYDNGSLVEQQNGQVTQPGLPTPLANQNPPEIGNSGTGEEPSSLPEAAPALANDGQ